MEETGVPKNVLKHRLEKFQSLLFLQRKDDNLGRYFTRRSKWMNDGRQWNVRSRESPFNERFEKEKDWFGKTYKDEVYKVFIECMNDTERDAPNGANHPFFENILPKHTTIRSKLKNVWNYPLDKIMNEVLLNLKDLEQWDELCFKKDNINKIDLTKFNETFTFQDGDETCEGKLKNLYEYTMIDTLLNNDVTKEMYFCHFEFQRKDKKKFDILFHCSKEWLEDYKEEELEGEEGEGEAEVGEEKEKEAEEKEEEEGEGQEEEEEEDGSFELPSPGYYLVGFQLDHEENELNFIYSLEWDFQGFDYAEFDEFIEDYALVLDRLIFKYEELNKIERKEEEEEEEEEEEDQEEAKQQEEVKEEDMKTKLLALLNPPGRILDRISRLKIPHPKSNPLLPPTHHCRHCGVEKEKLVVCSQCGIVCYCSDECRKAHWVMYHKEDCNRLKDVVVEEEEEEE